MDKHEELLAIEESRDLEDLRQLKARYCRLLDGKDWPVLRSLFTENATFRTPTIEMDGADQFIEWVSELLKHAETVHQVTMPEIKLLSAETAEAVWAMWDIVDHSPEAGRPGFRGYGHYHERYVKRNGHWLIESWQLTRMRLEPLTLSAP
jgi:hypothetical protein